MHYGPSSRPNEFASEQSINHTDPEVGISGDESLRTSARATKESHLAQHRLEIDSPIIMDSIKASRVIPDTGRSSTIMTGQYEYPQTFDAEVQKLDGTVKISARSGLNTATAPKATTPTPFISVTGSSVPAGQRAIFRRKSRIQFAALCLCLFLEGWNSGHCLLYLNVFTSTLIPGWFSRRLYRTFTACHSGILSRTSLSIGMHHIYGTKIAACQVGFALVSLIFVINCLVSIYLCLRCSIKR